jgi:hypothetical protein
MDAPSLSGRRAFRPVQRRRGPANTGMHPVQEPSWRVICRMAGTRDGSTPPEGQSR